MLWVDRMAAAQVFLIRLREHLFRNAVFRLFERLDAHCYYKSCNKGYDLRLILACGNCRSYIVVIKGILDK